MSVAVLERNVESSEREERKQLQINRTFERADIADERHNAQISSNYAKLINPNVKLDEVLGRAGTENASAAAVATEQTASTPYFVQSARTNADIFRADSPLNRIAVNEEVCAAEDSEEENEDLRPTATTIQYKTTGVNKTVEEGKAEARVAEKRVQLSKKEKIVIAAVVSIIVALFVLIIVNSAIISGMKSDTSSLQSSLATVKASWQSAHEEFEAAKAAAEREVENYALLNGLLKH